MKSPFRNNAPKSRKRCSAPKPTLPRIRPCAKAPTTPTPRPKAPAYENYRFSDDPAGCKLVVTLDTAPDWEQYMLDTFPKALALLKSLCEQP